MLNLSFNLNAAATYWQKRGLIYSLDERLPWAHSHTQIPTVDVGDERMQVLFSSRDKSNRSYIARMEVATSDPSRILDIQQEPVLSPGPAGSFDDCGVMPSSIVKCFGVRYLFYIGWNVSNTVPYHNSVGLAVSEDGGLTYRRLFDGPVMDRTPDEPYFSGTTCVRLENGVFRNWYMACTSWDPVEGKMEPRYHLKYAESADGIHWRRDGVVAIDYADAFEGGVCRASVCKDRDLYRMWFCYRAQAGYRETWARSYRIGYAESADGVVWSRNDENAGIETSEEGWDSFMLAYPEVVDAGSRRYLFYNGNGFGQTGFGFAEARSGWAE